MPSERSMSHVQFCMHIVQRALLTAIEQASRFRLTCESCNTSTLDIWTESMEGGWFMQEKEGEGMQQR
jgi:hypothetical protein